jgi:uncharacterized protein YggE
MKTMRNCIVFWGVVLALAPLLSGCDGTRDAGERSTVSVSGAGTVLARPDMAAMSVSISHVAPTTRQAQETVNAKVRQTLDILKEAEIEDKDITTASLRFNPEYEWRGGKNVFIGQKAEQSISFSVYDIQKDSTKVPGLIDKIALVDKVSLSRVQFDVKDKTELYSKARELAYRKALDKALQYAGLSGMKIGRALSISETDGAGFAPVAQNKMMYRGAAGEVSAADTSTSLPTGELEITSRVVVVFLLE